MSEGRKPLRARNKTDFERRSLPEALPEWNERSAEWLRAGAITFPHERIKGIVNAPQAIVDTIGGRHLGTVVVEL